MEELQKGWFMLCFNRTVYSFALDVVQYKRNDGKLPSSIAIDDERQWGRTIVRLDTGTFVATIKLNSEDKLKELTIKLNHHLLYDYKEKWEEIVTTEIKRDVYNEMGLFITSNRALNKKTALKAKQQKDKEELQNEYQRLKVNQNFLKKSEETKRLYIE